MKVKYILYFILAFAVLSAVNFVCGNISSVNRVAQNEFNAQALLKKYEYFKNLSGAIDKKDADIAVYREELASVEKPTTSDERFYLEQRKSELLGIISIRNNLASEYNIAMSKFNYRFCNAGDLPETNMQPLPREFKPYILSLKNK